VLTSNWWLLVTGASRSSSAAAPIARPSGVREQTHNLFRAALSGVDQVAILPVLDWTVMPPTDEATTGGAFHIASATASPKPSRVERCRMTLETERRLPRAAYPQWVNKEMRVRRDRFSGASVSSSAAKVPTRVPAPPAPPASSGR
jgi:hypothetical protein